MRGPAAYWYLADGPGTYPSKHRQPIVSGIPRATKGSQPTDGGNLIVEPADYDTVTADAIAARYVRRLVGARDMLNGTRRWCLWLVDASPGDLRQSLTIRRRLEAVADMRRGSRTASVREQAATPAVFTQIRQPTSGYLCIPRHSSENRAVIPMEMMTADVIAHDSTLTIDGCPKWLFGVLQSTMYMAWVGTICGRLESRFRVDPDLAIHAFPFVIPTRVHETAIVDALDEVLAARESHSPASLADLYDSLAMPPSLATSHRELDRAVDRSFGFRRREPTEADRLTYLLARYEELTAPLTASSPQRGRRRRP